MDRLINALKYRASGMDAQSGQPRWGTVQSYDPNYYLAKVLIQPENILTGWLPIVAPMVGNNCGVVSPLIQGQQVIVIADNGDANSGVVLGGTWSTQATLPQPPAAPGGQAAALQPGEFAIVTPNNSFVRFAADGTVLMVGSTIYALGSSSDTPLRLATETFVFNLFNSHTHGGVSTGTGDTGAPIQQATTADVTAHLKAS